MLLKNTKTDHEKLCLCMQALKVVSSFTCLFYQMRMSFVYFSTFIVLNYHPFLCL